MAEETSYSLSQAAALLSVREDSVVAFLGECGVDFTRRSPATITQAEMDILAKIVIAVKAIWREFTY